MLPVGRKIKTEIRVENSSDGLDPLDRKDRAKRYLPRIVALTDAPQMDDAYVLDAGKMPISYDPPCGFRG